MGNVFSCSCNPCDSVNFNKVGQYALCPGWEMAELRSALEMLKRNRKSVKKEIRELEGQPGLAVRVVVREWVDAVKKFKREASVLLEDLNRHPPCIRSACCFFYHGNFRLAKKIADMLKESKNLKAEHDGWGGNLAIKVESCRTPEEAIKDQLWKLEAMKKDLEEEIISSGGRKQKSHRQADWLRRVGRVKEDVNMLEDQQQKITNELERRQMEEYKAEKTARIRAEIADLCSEWDKLGIVVMSPAPHISDEEMMEKEWETLKAHKKDLESNIKVQISNHSRSRKAKPSSRVDVWLRRVDELATEVDEVYTIFDANRPNRIARIRADIQNLISDEKAISKRGDLVIPEAHSEMPDLSDTPPKFLVGVENHTATIFNYLEDDRVSIIGILGMGGVGKTTLVKEMIKRLPSRKTGVKFDLIIFVEVSQNPNIVDIQEQIGFNLGWSNSKDDVSGSSVPSGEIERAKILKRLLSKKSFLLILDGVWKKLDFGKIGVPPLGNGRKSKVLLTTRELKVCEVMGCNKKLLVSTLGKEDSQNLFYSMCEKHREYLKMEKEIGEIVERIVSKCGGLPLVIINVASALKTNSSVQEWREAECLLRCSPDCHIPGMTGVFKLLKSSFDHLERDEYRSCLLFCALFPENSDIHIDGLIKYWIGEGLLDFTRISDHLSLEAFGRQNIISALCGACLLEKGKDENHVKMHNSIRDMAIWLGRGGEDDNYMHKFLTLESAREKNMEKATVVDNKWKGVKRVGIRGKKEVVLSSDISSSALNSLRTLVFEQQLTSTCRIPEELFSFSTNLRVLDLSNNIHLDSLPNSLWLLKSLRYLNLSKTILSKIPMEGLRQLRNLVVLDLSDCKWLVIPYIAISFLPKLQILELRGDNISSIEGGIKDLNKLACLRSLSPPIVHTLADVKEIQESDVLNKSISYLQLRSVENITAADVSSVVSDVSYLKKLLIRECKDLEGSLQLVSNSLQNLELNSLPHVSSLAVESQRKLPNLSSLQIQCCNQLRDLECLLHLPKLVKLHVSDCNGMVELIPFEPAAAAAAAAARASSSVTTHPSIPKLELIVLTNLRSLKGISKVRLHSPSLRSMELRGCPKLRKLTGIQSEQRVTVKTPKHLWEQLKWEEGACTARDRFLFRDID